MESKAAREEALHIRLVSPDGTLRFHAASSNGISKIAFIDPSGRDFVSDNIRRERMYDTVKELRNQGWKDFK